MHWAWKNVADKESQTVFQGAGEEAIIVPKEVSVDKGMG
jgi:hypothetical protein